MGGGGRELEEEAAARRERQRGTVVIRVCVDGTAVENQGLKRDAKRVTHPPC